MGSMIHAASDTSSGWAPAPHPGCDPDLGRLTSLLSWIGFGGGEVADRCAIVMRHVRIDISFEGRACRSVLRPPLASGGVGGGGRAADGSGRGGLVPGRAPT